MRNPTRNNLIVELYVPDLNVVKEFYMASDGKIFG